eukprot:TRINITY_DN5618_c0_g1_i2.p1 TRINITY_DN5618_c0_g1~~TRINITY_DN5618_c0_g1_i2.p1  ORF type:complete len:622 (+),score=50.57 TRINITY_DN5618_c0_g1_i2:103-1968(+)
MSSYLEKEDTVYEPQEGSMKDMSAVSIDPVIFNGGRTGFLTKIIYGFPALPFSAVFNFLYTWKDSIFLWPYSFVHLKVIVLTIHILSGINTLLFSFFGWYSDTLLSAYGRRQSIIAFLSFFVTTAFVLFVLLPQQLKSWRIFSEILILGLFQTAHFLRIAYNALGMQLSIRSDERVMVFSWRQVFSVVGSAVGFAFSFHYVRTIQMNPESHSFDWTMYTITAVIAGIFLLSLLMMVLQITERKDLGITIGDRSPVPPIIQVWHNGPFKRVILVSALRRLLFLPRFLILRCLLFLSIDDIFYVMLTSYGAGFLSSPIWAILGVRIENRSGAIVSYVFMILGNIPPVLLLDKEEGYKKIASYVMAVLLGIGESGITIFEDSMQADCVEYDQLLHGGRREAQFETTKRVFWVIADCFGFLSMQLITSLGYDITSQGEPPYKVFIALKALLAGSILLTVMQLAFMLSYPISREVHRKIIEGIQLHRENSQCSDPVKHCFLRPPFQTTVPKKIKQIFDSFPRWELRRALYKGPWALFRLLLIVTVIGTLLMAGCVTGLSFVTRLKDSEFLWLYVVAIYCIVFSLGFVLWNFLRLPISLTVPKYYQFVNIYLYERQTSTFFGGDLVA